MPFIFKSGIVYSNNIFKGATALAIETSNLFLFFIAKSSILEWKHSQFVNSNLEITSFKKLTLLFKLSIKVNLQSGLKIASGIDGKPAPARKSQQGRGQKEDHRPSRRARDPGAGTAL